MNGVPVDAVYAMDAALQKHAIYLGRVTIAELLAAVAPLIAAAERERCARVLDARVMGDCNREDQEAKRCAAAIRALGDADE